MRFDRPASRFDRSRQRLRQPTRVDLLVSRHEQPADNPRRQVRLAFEHLGAVDAPRLQPATPLDAREALPLDLVVAVQGDEQAAFISVAAAEPGVSLDTPNPVRIKPAALERQLDEGLVFSISLADRRQHACGDVPCTGARPVAFQHDDPLALITSS